MTIVPSLQLEFVQEVLADLAAVSLTPSEVPDDGGVTLRLYGRFQPNLGCLVEILVGAIPYVCYSADYGRGNAPLPLGENLLFCATPQLPISAGSSAYDVRITQGAETVTLAGALTVRARSWRSGVFDFRKVLPARWRRGNLGPDTALLVSDIVASYVFGVEAVDGTPYSQTPSTYNPQGGTPVWSSVGTALPGWLVLNTATGELAGTPGPGDVGTTEGHAIDVTANGATFTSNTFSIEVAA